MDLTLWADLCSGKYSWLCCIPKDRVNFLHHIATNMSATQFRELYDSACACGGAFTPPSPSGPSAPELPKPPGPVTPPPVLPVSTCTQRMYDRLCSEEVSTSRKRWRDAISVAKLIPTLPSYVASALTALDAALSSIDTMCASGKPNAAIIYLMCSAYNKAKKTAGVGPYIDKGLDDATVKLMDECCPIIAKELGLSSDWDTSGKPGKVESSIHDSGHDDEAMRWNMAQALLARRRGVNG